MRNKLFEVFVCMLLVSTFFVGIPETVRAPQDGDYTYTVSGNPLVATITGYTGAGGAITIPSTLGGYPTVAIGDSAFNSINGHLITSVIIPDSVTTIGIFVFEYCSSLTTVTIPNSVTTIGYAAFAYCSSLTTVIIGNGVTTIGDYAFYYCTSLTSVTIGNGVTTIGDSAFYYCTSLTSVTIGNSITTIGDYAFQNCQHLTAITIGNNVTTIGGYAFSNCLALATLTVPNSVTTIEVSAFGSCFSLTTVTIGSGVTTIGEYAFYYCTSLTSITFLGLVAPTTVDATWIQNTPVGIRGHASTASNFPAPGIAWNGLTMGAYIEDDYTYTVSNGEATITGYTGAGGNIMIPPALVGCPTVHIGDGAFHVNTNLTSVTIPDSVTTIGYNAFSFCSILTSVTIGNSVTTIGNNAFFSCTHLNSVTMGSSITSIGDGAFEVCTQLTTVTIPNSVTTIGNNAFNTCTDLTTVTIGNSVTTIGNFAFNDCSALTSITFLGLVAPTTVGVDWILNTPAGISGHAYYGSNFPAPGGVWNGLTMGAVIPIPEDYSYTVSSGAATITGYTGAGGVITIPSTLGGYPTVYIGDGAFNSNTNLISVTIPNSVITIGNHAFDLCYSLTTVTIPDSVTAIGNYAFAGCSILTVIDVSTGNANYASIDGVLYNKAITTLIQYPGGKTGAFTIPSSIITIGDGAFGDCTQLTTVTIPDSVTAIGYFAFAGCSALIAIDVSAGNANYASVNSVLYNKAITTLIQYPGGKTGTFTIPSSVTTIGDYAFYDCSSLTSVTIPNIVITIGVSAFEGCSFLTAVTIPNSVTTIGNWAFGFCTSLTTVTIGNSVTTIGDFAFADCSALASITFLGLVAPTTVGSNWIGNTPVEIRGHASAASNFPAPGNSFYGLTMGDYSSEDYLYSVSGGVATITGYTGAGGAIMIPSTLGGYPTVAIGDNAFNTVNGHLITSVVIPSGVTTIGNYAFEYCSLTSVTIPNSVTTIGDWAFGYCSSLTSMTIPDSVITIGGSAFYFCTSLTAVTIPSSVTTIGDWAFHLTSLTTIDVSAGNANYASVDGVLYNKAITTLIQYPSGKKTGTFTIPSSITVIGQWAFSYCSYLTSVTIPNSVTTIENDAFAECSSLTTVTIPNSVITIGDGAFYYCTHLTTVTIGSGVTTIRAVVFNGCSALTSITFLGLVAPTTVDATWIQNTPVGIRGHASAASNFPAPGNYWNGLMMGTYINIYDVNHDGTVNFQDAGLVWVHRTSLVPYDGLYDVNQDGQVNFQDAGLVWVHRD